MKIVKDRRIKNAILRQVCKENEIHKDDLYCNEYYSYMEYSNDVSITLIKTSYKGDDYTFKYFDGCFNAFMVKLT